MTSCHDQQARKICDFGMTPVTSSSLVPTSSSNESHTRSVELRARSKFTTHERVSHSCRRASHSFQIRKPRSRSTEDRQPPCSASTTTRSRGKELNGAPLPCLPCFCSVSCAQGMTFCLTLKGCASCEGGVDVVGVVTPLVGGVAQAFHGDQVVELRVQLAA